MSPKRKSLDERAFVFGEQREVPPEIKSHLATNAPASTLSVDEIRDRPLGNTRELDAQHVADLAESIAALGLIEPLVLDKNNCLLAGAHRHAAILQLRETKPEVFAERFPNGQVPVQVMPLDAAADSDLALAIEAAENEKRRDYTPAEIRAIAERLRAAGYEDLKGRPKKGQKPLMPALSVVVGKSMRTVQRHLYGESESAPKKSATDDALLKKKLLKQALTNLKRWQSMKLTSDEKKVAEQVSELSLLIEELLEQECRFGAIPR
jgi:ParB family chromosome partitioning protein